MRNSRLAIDAQLQGIMLCTGKFPERETVTTQASQTDW